MITPTLVALWIVALTFFPQGPQSCNGECPDGTRSVCVQRGGACKCACIKDVASGVTALRELLHEYNVSQPTIDEAESRYRNIAGQTAGEFSFTVSDSQTGDWTIKGQGLIGTATPGIADAVTTEIVVDESTTATQNKMPSQPPKKVKYTKKNLRTKKRTTKRAP